MTLIALVAMFLGFFGGIGCFLGVINPARFANKKTDEMRTRKDFLAGTGIFFAMFLWGIWLFPNDNIDINSKEPPPEFRHISIQIANPKLCNRVPYQGCVRAKYKELNDKTIGDLKELVLSTRGYDFNHDDVGISCDGYNPLQPLTWVNTVAFDIINDGIIHVDWKRPKSSSSKLVTLPDDLSLHELCLEKGRDHAEWLKNAYPDEYKKQLAEREKSEKK